MHFFVHYYPNDEYMTPRQSNKCCIFYPYCKARLQEAGPQVLPKMQTFSSLPERQGILLLPPNHKLTLILFFTPCMMLPFDMSFVQQTDCCMQILLQKYLLYSHTQLSNFNVGLWYRNIPFLQII